MDTQNQTYDEEMGGLVLAKHPSEGWLLINRHEQRAVRLNDEEVVSLPENGIIRRTPSKNFISASYEITEACNYRCKHCYLDGNTIAPPLGIEHQIEVIDSIEKAGVLWLQISGGEPLICPTFEEIYRYAWDRGIVLIILTNGSLLGKRRYLRLFTDRPPFRISVSLYGASRETYETVTRRPGSWATFKKSVEAAREAGLAIRMKIIEMADNTHEYDEMSDFAEAYSEVDVVRDLIPTLRGNLAPLDFRCQPTASSSCWSGCEAGVQAFHVTAGGQACLCKIARTPSGICPPLYRLLTQEGSKPCPEVQLCVKAREARSGATRRSPKTPPGSVSLTGR